MGIFITADDFVNKWSHSKLSEKSGLHEHFIDLCHLLNEPTPSEVGTEGLEYTFEKKLNKTTGKHGWADVWKKGCFAWEYKSHHRDLVQAYVQLQRIFFNMLIE
jgi:hypothetical protein